ncbi:hypothetical protein J3R82DRAFT_7318 [Butyriboletus roseoflavus]|nr:hypothetical protein J3R82DRAFT_7318 [Butyriboletus roseoflavus]
MYFAKSFTVLAAVAALASATPGVDRRDESNLLQHLNRDNCQNHLGNCYKNGQTHFVCITSVPLTHTYSTTGCEGVFANPYDTIGTCAAGKWRGCPCEKCGSTGKCVKNGCEGYQGRCTAGNDQGCPCK